MKLIEKSAIVAEIKRRKELVSDPILLGNDLMIGERNAYFNLLSFIDSLEVKEVDLEKESELIANGIMIGVQANKYHTCVYNTTRCDFNHSHLMIAARKGIELGLKAKNRDNE